MTPSPNVQPAEGGSGTVPAVSVIVRAHNEARHLGRLLDDVRAQSVGAEIVVVDSGSTDGSQAIAEARADRLVAIRPEDFTFGRSLNYGCAAASGEIFAIVSAHTYPGTHSWLANLVAPFEDPKVAMVYGRQLAAPTTRIGEARDFEVVYGEYSKVLVDEPFGNNANSAVRASLWREHHFDERLTGLEDIEWARHFQQRGYTVHYVANAPIVHIHEESPRQVYRRFFREGAAHAELFPGGREPLGYVLAKGTLDTARDLYFGRDSGMSARELLAAPLFRASATLGFYRGGLARERARPRAARSALGHRTPERRVVVTGPGAHQLANGAAPSPGAGEALIRVAYVGVCMTDVEIARGRQPYYTSGVASFPIVPGHEYSGVVEAVGSGVDRGLVGARVVAECVIGCGHCAMCLSGSTPGCPNRLETGVLGKDGAYATHVVVPATVVHRIPDALPLRAGALAEPVAVVLKALRRAMPLRGRRAVVVGAGPIGHLAAQALRMRHAEVLVVDRDERRLEPLLGMAFSTATEISPRVLAGADTVIEATGAPGVLDEVAAAAPAGARLVVLGVPGEDAAGIQPAALVARDQEVVGSLASDPADWPAAIAALRSRKLDVGPLIDDVRVLEDYEAAWEAASERTTLKTLLSVDRALAEA